MKKICFEFHFYFLVFGEIPNKCIWFEFQQDSGITGM